MGRNHICVEARICQTHLTLPATVGGSWLLTYTCVDKEDTYYVCLNSIVSVAKNGELGNINHYTL